MNPRWIFLALLIAPLVPIACAHESAEGPTPPQTAMRWVEAEQLFRGDARWRGGDAAYSVPIDDERTLWLFGDSFVRPIGAPPAGDRAHSRMVRNTVAIMTGRDPTTASVEFHFGEVSREPEGGGPAVLEPGPYFTWTGPEWLWPGPGANMGGGLLLTFAVIAPSDEGLGFTTIGSRARWVRDPRGPFESWSYEEVDLPAGPPGVQLGLGALLVDAEGRLAEGAHLYSFAPVEPGAHPIFLTRWPLERVAAGDLSAPGFWAGSAWSADPAEAVPLFLDGQTEIGVHQEGPEVVLTQVDGFGGANVGQRRAPGPQGPWSPLSVVHRPEDQTREDVLMYSAKAHPHLQSPSGGVVLTYCTNHLDFWTMAGDMNLYFPRFLVSATPSSAEATP